MLKNLNHLTIAELQSYALAGEEAALIELGMRVLHMRLHDDDGDFFCRHRFELEELQAALDVELPLECPHCGGWLTDL